MAAHPGPSLKRALMASAVWTMVGWAVMQVLRFGSNLILTRLLFPEAFGLMSLVTVFIVGLHMFSDVGIGPSLVQSERGDEPDFYNTAWTVQILRGLGLWLIAVVIAWPVSLFYDEPGLPSLKWLLPAVGLEVAISAFDSTALYTLDRRLAQGRRVALQIGNTLITMAVTIGLAWLYASVWALVVGNLVAALINMVCSHMLVSGVRNRLHWDRTALVSLLHFGRWVFFGTVLTFLGNQGDRLVIGKLSLILLGVYHMGAILAAIPLTLLSTMAMQLVFPLYSRLLQKGRTAPAVFARVHPACAGFAAFLATGLIASGPTFIRGAYDIRYQGAGWIVQILAVGAWFQMLETLLDALLWGLGKANVSAYSNLAKVLALPVLAPLGYWLHGIEGLIAGFAATDLVRYGVSVWYIRHHHGVPVLRYDLCLGLLILAVSTAALAAGELLWADRVRPQFLAVLGAAPQGGFPAAVPWSALPLSYQKDWALLLPRFATEVGVVVLLWGLILLLAWYKRLVRTSWGEEPQ
jgi:O-antigen/teichoic acid export membrane protein